MRKRLEFCENVATESLSKKLVNKRLFKPNVNFNFGNTLAVACRVRIKTEHDSNLRVSWFLIPVDASAPPSFRQNLVVSEMVAIPKLNLYW